MGACFGPQKLISVLIAAVFVEGLMALALVIYKRDSCRPCETCGTFLVRCSTCDFRGQLYSIDNPDAIKTPVRTSRRDCSRGIWHR